MEFTAPVWEWRGPAPYHFVSVPPAESEAIAEIAEAVSYGWGMIPVPVVLGRSRWGTSLYTTDGGYALPLRDPVRAEENTTLGAEVQVQLTVRQ